jgi:hypothetical protein
MGIPQTSASERVEAAREALAEYGRSQPSDYERAYADPLAAALRALITPPSVGESEEAIVEDFATRLREQGAIEILGQDAVFRATDHHGQSVTAFRQGVRAGIQSAHETWEPADRPSQEMMLRWLGLDYTIDGDVIVVHRKNIEREEI